jgi:hypothetical protein
VRAITEGIEIFKSHHLGMIMMKYYVFTGRPVNAAYSLYDFMSNKRSTFIWGFPERYRSHPDSSKRNKNVKFYDEMQKEVENEKRGVKVVTLFYTLLEKP